MSNAFNAIGRAEIWPLHQRCADLGGHLRILPRERVALVLDPGSSFLELATLAGYMFPMALRPWKHEMANSNFCVSRCFKISARIARAKHLNCWNF